jgi:hypothetical protein
MRMREAARRLGRAIFRRPQDELPLSHGHRGQVLAEQMSKVAGVSLVWCSFDGEPLTAIVHANGHGTEVVGLACLNCHSFVATPAGVLGEQRASDDAFVSA